MDEKKVTKVLLMLPLRPKESNDFFYVPDLGLGYLAASLQMHLADRVSTDLLVKDLRISDDEFARYLQRHDFDVVGVKIFSDALESVKRTVKLIKDTLPDALILAGGPHVNAMPEHAIKELDFDYAIHGDAERSLALLVGALDGGKINNKETLYQIDGLVWKDEQTIRANDPALMEDLDEISQPRWDLMPPDSFARYQTRYCRQYPPAPVLLTRGCSFRCTFCTQADSNFRKRTVRSALDEIDNLRKKYRVKEFHVLDDNCAHDKQFITSFCRGLIDEQPGILWRVPGGICVSSIDDEVCYLLAQSGCYEIWMGIESGSQRILDAMHKGTTLEKIRKAVTSAKRYKINVGGFFILGYPGETDADRRQTLSFALSLPLDYAKFTIFIPQPGTEMFNRLAAGGDIKGAYQVIGCADNEFENALTDISSKQIRTVHRDYSLRFFMRYRIVAGIIREYNSLAKFVYLLHAARQFIFNRRASW